MTKTYCDACQRPIDTPRAGELKISGNAVDICAGCLGAIKSIIEHHKWTGMQTGAADLPNQAAQSTVDTPERGGL